MKPLHRLAIALGVAQVVALVAASRHHATAGVRPDRAGRDCGPARGPRGRGRHRSHDGSHHGHDTTGHARGGHRGPGGPGGPPPWVRARLEEWHRDQHVSPEPNAGPDPATAADEEN